MFTLIAKSSAELHCLSVECLRCPKVAAKMNKSIEVFKNCCLKDLKFACCFALIFISDIKTIYSRFQTFYYENIHSLFVRCSFINELDLSLPVLWRLLQRSWKSTCLSYLGRSYYIIGLENWHRHIAVCPLKSRCVGIGGRLNRLGLTENVKQVGLLLYWRNAFGRWQGGRSLEQFIVVGELI